MSADVTPPRAILFDWDNTLIDSWPTIHAANAHSTTVVAGTVGGGGSVEPEPLSAGRMVVSLSRGPGAVEKYVLGLSTIWSTMAPSSRCWMRTVWVPLVAKYTATPAVPHPLSAHP